MNFNQFLNEASSSSYGGRAGLTKDETLKIAQKFADAAASVDPQKGKWTVNKRTLEEDGFDLDYNNEEFDGGSYNIYKNGNVVNMALRENPVLGKVDDDIKTIAKGFKKMMMNESLVNENTKYAVMLIGGSIGDTPRPRDAKGYAGTASTTEDLYTKDKAKEKADRMNKTVLTAGEKKHYGLKYVIVPVKDGKFIKESFLNEAANESVLDEGTISPKMANSFKIGDEIKTQKDTYTITGYGSKTGATRDFEAENGKGEQCNLRVSLRGTTGIQVAVGARNLNFPEQQEMLESVVNEAIEIVYYSEVLDNWGRTESSEKPDIILKVLQSSDEWTDDMTFQDKNGKNYDIDELIGKQVKIGSKTITIKESVVNERNITIKRQYTANRPAVTVGKAAKIRNRMLEAIKDGKLSQEEFNTILKEMTTDSKRWLRRNAQCFNVSEDGISLSKTGSRILKNVMIAEATTKNPKIWVPGDFDKAIAKYPNRKITRKIVLDAAKKWDVNPDDAIKYVEFGWMVDLDENKNNNDMKTKFIYESFQEFVTNKLHESKESEEASNILDDLLGERDMEELHGMSIEDALDTVKTYGHSGTKAKKIAEELFGMCNESTLNEAFKSAKLANLFSVGSAGTKDLAGAFYNFSKLAIDQIQDYDIIEMDPQTARKEKRANAVYFYVVTNQKVNPYSETGTIPSTWNNGLIQSNTLLAITNGQNEWYSTAYSSYSKTQTLKVTNKREDAAGFDKRDSKRYDGSGITSLTKVAELADIAYVIDLDVLKARYSTTSLQFKRAEDKRGAIAFQSDKDFKAANKARYNEILAQKASELPMDSIVLGTIDTLATQIKDALSKGEKGRYGELIIGLDPRGREIKMSDASNLMRNILDEYNRYVGYVVESEKEVATGYSGKFYEGRLKESAKTITDYVKKVEAKNYAW